MTTVLAPPETEHQAREDDESPADVCHLLDSHMEALCGRRGSGMIESQALTIDGRCAGLDGCQRARCPDCFATRTR